MKTGNLPTYDECLEAVAFTLKRKSMGHNRAQKLFDLCQKYNVSLDDVSIEQHTDYRWGWTAKNRFDIGSRTVGKYCRERWWAVIPAEAVSE